MNQTEQLRKLQEIEENAYKEKNNKNRYLLFQEAADGYVAKKDVTVEDLEHAYQLYEEACNAALKTRNLKFKCQALIDLGSTSDKLGNTDDAIKFYQEALEIAELRKDKEARRAQNRINTKLGLVHTKIGNYELADYYYEKANETAIVPWRTEETTPKLLPEPQQGIRPSLLSTPRTIKHPRVEIISQVKHVDQINAARRKVTSIVSIFLTITLVIIITNIFINPHGHTLTDVLVIFLSIIIIITLAFQKRIFTFIFREDTQD